jgi:hypothetical protein
VLIGGFGVSSGFEGLTGPARTASVGAWREKLQVSPLSCASVEMTGPARTAAVVMCWPWESTGRFARTRANTHSYRMEPRHGWAPEFCADDGGWEYGRAVQTIWGETLRRSGSAEGVAGPSATLRFAQDDISLLGASGGPARTTGVWMVSPANSCADGGSGRTPSTHAHTANSHRPRRTSRDRSLGWACRRGEIPWPF